MDDGFVAYLHGKFFSSSQEIRRLNVDSTLFPIGTQVPVAAPLLRSNSVSARASGYNNLFNPTRLKP